MKKLKNKIPEFVSPEITKSRSLHHVAVWFDRASRKGGTNNGEPGDTWDDRDDRDEGEEEEEEEEEEEDDKQEEKDDDEWSPMMFTSEVHIRVVGEKPPKR